MCMYFICAGVCVCVRVQTGCVYPHIPLCEHIAGYALSSCEYTMCMYFPDFECMFVFVCVCMFVCVHSDEAGEAAWRLIHHFPPWPAVPSEERCAVTVTLGSFWSRKMVHPPPASPLPPPPPPSFLRPTSQLRRRSNNPSNSLRLPFPPSALHAVSTGTDC